MAVNVGNLEATLGMDTKGFKDGVKEAEKGTKGIGASLSSLKVPLLAVGAAIGAAFAAVGVAAFKSADDIDKAMANIRVGTGATGDALAEMGDNMRNVMKQVPGDAATVGSAMADINTRLGLTGTALEDTTKQYVELARITGGDVSTSIKNTTRLFSLFGVAAEEETLVLDYLFKVAQSTGASVDQLAASATMNGAALQGMGFDLESSIALLGKFEKEGVAADTILASMKRGMGTMAAAGITDANEAFKTLTAGVKNAGSELEAVAIASETFGTRAGADMARAIRSGSFELEDFVKELNSSSETILQAAEDSKTLGDRFGILKNNVMLAIEPIGERIISVFEQVTDWMSTDGMALLDPLLAAFAAMEGWWDGSGEGIITKIVEAFQWLKDTFQPFIDMYMDFWSNQATKMTDFWEEDGAMVMEALENIRAAFQVVIEYIVALWEWVWPYMENIYGAFVDILLDIVGIFAALFAGDWETLKDKLIDLSLDLMDLMYGVFELGFDAVLGLFVAIGNGINAVLTGAWNMVLGGLEAMINKAIDMLNGLISSMNKIPGVNIPLIGKVSFERAEAKKLEAPKLSDFTGGEKPTDKAREMIEAERAEKKRLEEAEKEAAMTPEEKKAALIQKELGMTLEDNKKALEEANKKPTVPPMSATPTPTEIVQTDPIEIVTDKPVPVVGITDDVFQDLTAELKAFSFDAVVDAINNARDMLVAAITGGVDKTIAEEEELITDLVSEEEEITPATLGEKISQALSETVTNMRTSGADFEVDTMSNMPLILNQDIHITTEIDGYEIGKAVYSTWNKRTGGGLNII